MPTFQYRARDAAGKAVKGAMEAHSKVELTDKLQKLGYVVTQITDALPVAALGSFFDSLRRIGIEDMVMFNIQLANLIHAGIPLLSGLKTLKEQIENRRLREIIGMVSRSVEGGESFSEALTHYPQIFPSLLINVVRVGEASGKLDTVLTRYASYCEQQADLSQKVKGAVVYPVFLLFASVGVILFIVTTIIPQFAAIFIKAGVSLPLPTFILYHVGTGIKQFWISLILFTLVGWFSLQYYAGTKKGGLLVDRLKLRLPLFGPLFRRAGIARLARTLGMLVASGVPLIESLTIAKEAAGNKILERVMTHVRRGVEKGGKVSEALQISKEFPPDVVHMVAVGEETGNLDEMLDKIADFYDRAVGYTVKKLTTLVEPALLIVMGSLIGFIMASLLLPMFDMIQVFRR